MSKSRVPKSDRRKVAAQAHYCCEYCLSQARFCPDPLTIDHINPRDKGGLDTLDNLALSCQGCNDYKFTATSAVDPVTGEIAPLYHPRRDEWQHHFAWSDDYSLLTGLTPTGRATIARLQLNRPGVVNIRRALRITGEHPPVF